MSDSLAVRAVLEKSAEPRGSTALTRVTQALETIAARDHNGELLTAVRQYPARAAQWAEFPEWMDEAVRRAY